MRCVAIWWTVSKGKPRVVFYPEQVSILHLPVPLEARAAPDLPHGAGAALFCEMLLSLWETRFTIS